MKQKKIIFTIFILFIIILTSCETTSSVRNSNSQLEKPIKYDKKKFEKYLQMGDYHTCALMLRGKKTNNNDKILDNLNLALFQHYDGDFESSINTLNETDILMQDSVTKSITKSIGSTILNDNIAQYTGTVYEYLYVNVINALNYYQKNNLEEAMVEIRKLNNKQKEYIEKYGNAILQEFNRTNDESLIRESEGVDYFKIDKSLIYQKMPESPSEKVIFRDSSTARFLSMVFRNMYGDVDNAKIDRSVLSVLNPNINTKEEFAIPNGKGRLNVLSFSDFVGSRKEVTFNFPRDFTYSREQYIKLPSIYDFDIPQFDLKFVYPTYDRNSIVRNVQKVRIVFDNGDVYDIPLLEDFNSVVENDVKSKEAALFTKSVIRSISKKMTAVASGIALLKITKESIRNAKVGFLGALTYEATYLSVAAAIEAVDFSETADLRQCDYLPGKSNALGLSLPEGVYSFRIQYISPENEVIFTERFENIEVVEGKSTLVESLCVK
ncbi:MAG: hypothetical protein GX677_06150 [Treponema sp.]|jgi:uncharacterized protein|nr:hypothetical protein [Treponema sp.]